VLLIFLPISSEAQKILIDEKNTAPNKRKIEISPLRLVSTSKTKMSLSLGTVGPSIYLRLSGSGTGTNIVNVGDKVIFHLDNDSTITVQSSVLQTYDVEEITSTYQHSYNLSYADLAKFSRHNLKRLRKYHADGFDEFDIPNQSGRQVKNFSSLLIDELKKMNITGTDTTFVALEKKKPDSVKIKEIEPPKIINSVAGFPGGENTWMNFLKRNLQPPSELKANEKKIVQVQFLVASDGAIKELEIVQSAGPAFDKEVLRVLKRMPYWKPEIKNGQPVNAVVTKSITFFRDTSSASL
jgi:TonB family protein